MSFAPKTFTTGTLRMPFDKNRVEPEIAIRKQAYDQSFAKFVRKVFSGCGEDEARCLTAKICTSHTQRVLLGEPNSRVFRPPTYVQSNSPEFTVNSVNARGNRVTRLRGSVPVDLLGAEEMRIVLNVDAQPRGAIKTPALMGSGTALGIRTQQVEIKYKKPMVHCGNNTPEMIHRDSFGKNVGSTSRSRRRDDGDIATKLNQFESPEPFAARCRARLSQQDQSTGGRARGGGGGYQISTTFWARYRMGLTHRFFIAPGGLNYFPEIKQFKRRLVPPRDGSRVSSSSCVRRLGRSGAAGNDTRRIIFRGWGTGGRSKVWDLQIGTGGQVRFFRQGIGRIFFFTTAPAAAPVARPVNSKSPGTILDAAGSQKNAAKIRVGGVGRSEMT